MKKIIFTKKNIDYGKNFFKKHRFLFFLFFVIIFFVLFFVLLINKNWDESSDKIILEESITQEEKNNCGENCVWRLIDGEQVEPSKENPFLISAIIDNHSEARPQFGLSLARVVYDIPAEGGINRYLAFFIADDETLTKIGPVRSARPYFLEIAQEYQSLLLHCGGSPEALAQIIKNKLLTLNEFYNEKYFLRSSRYIAPHNVLADAKKINEYLINNEYEKSIFTPWKFKNTSTAEIDSAYGESIFNSKIEIKNGQSQYNVEWNYNLENNNYTKKIAGQNHKDDAGQIISANNLIIQFVNSKILDQELRLKIDLIGRGRAIICLDGYCRDGYWQKFDSNSRTLYYYDNDKEVIFNSGKTWIHFIDERTKINISDFSM